MTRKIKIKKGFNTFRLSLSSLFVAFYLVIAFLFLFTNVWIDLIPEKRGMIGLILLAFAVLRFYVSFSRHKGKKIKLENIQKAKEKELTEPERSHFEPTEKVHK